MNDEFQAFKDLDVLTKMDHFYVVLMALEDIDSSIASNDAVIVSSLRRIVGSYFSWIGLWHVTPTTHD